MSRHLKNVIIQNVICAHMHCIINNYACIHAMGNRALWDVKALEELFVEMTLDHLSFLLFSQQKCNSHTLVYPENQVQLSYSGTPRTCTKHHHVPQAMLLVQLGISYQTLQHICYALVLIQTSGKYSHS